jgi:MFS superfamily sulfate permease-like transporter
MNTPPEKPFAKGKGRDLLASLVVFLVALPLCMGIAIASGAPVAAGLVSGIIGGIFVGFFGGAPLQVSGPAAGLTVICAEVIGRNGLAALGVVVMLAGAIQLLAGLCKLGQWFRAVSPAVVHGMLGGIGILILSSQIHVMVDDRPRQGGLANLLSIPEALQKGLPPPGWENRAERQTRLELLQAFGQLHERQTEIETHVALLVPSSQDEGAKAEIEQLKPFALLQQSLVVELNSVREKAASSPLGLRGEDASALPEAMQSAEASLAAALADLESGARDKCAESQQQAARALVDVLAGLKSHDWAAKVGLLSIAIIMLWQGLAPRRLRIVPGPLLAVAFVTWLAWAGSLPVLYVEVPDRLVDGLTFPTAKVFADVSFRELASASLFMAVIASAETLLCASAVDRMHTGPQTQYDRELTFQGMGNLLCGLVGALPMTGVIVRSAANVQAGATSRLSAILHGLWLLMFVVLCAPLLRLIPTAALAGILVYTGFRLIDVRGLVRLWKHDQSEALILLATLTLIVVDDLLVGVVTGLVLSAIKLLVKFSRLDVRIIPTRGEAEPTAVTLRIAGAATFLRLPILATRLDEVPHGVEVHIDSDRLTYIDEACLELLQSWVKQREAAGERIVVDRRRLKASQRGEWWDRNIGSENDHVRWPNSLAR